eukprot:TRINITY_DN5596_c0_g1_i1.p1 TRINITY_DN5596_c0_g1~~TRINITY_DN5596_c0_g1_i1.p1  ORF type:complete len:169 (-),score=24.60 TRINITY_DN5596_c0_g1_i1:101-607(-)
MGNQTMLVRGVRILRQVQERAAIAMTTKARFSQAENLPEAEEKTKKVRPTAKKRVVNATSFLNIDQFAHIDNTRKAPEKPVPISPILGPIEIQNPTISSKTYRWCSCGMSLKQPFCDDTHVGTSFKPLKFTIEEKVDKVSLCACKLTSRAPFCDGVTCVKLKSGEESK